MKASTVHESYGILSTTITCAWENESAGPKLEVHGTLFFGSTSHFLELFPETVVQKDCCEAHMVEIWMKWMFPPGNDHISLPETLLKMIFFFPDMWVSWRVVDQMNGMDGMDSTFRNERGKTLEFMTQVTGVNITWLLGKGAEFLNPFESIPHFEIWRDLQLFFFAKLWTPSFDLEQRFYGLRFPKVCQVIWGDW